MRLGETITVRIGDRSIALRPTLRAAMCLEREHGIERLAGMLLDRHIGAISDTIAATAYGPYDAEEIAALIIVNGMGETATALVSPLVSIVQGLAGEDLDAEELPVPTKAEGKPQTFAEVHRELFRIGTGKMGWTPDQTLNAAPIEIIEAWRGRVELLKDIFGGAEETRKPKGSPDDRMRAFIAHHQALAAQRGA